jgi:hypothetical protein
MKTLCIKSWKAFEEGNVYEYYITSEGYAGVSSYNVCSFSNVYTSFFEYRHLTGDRCYHEYFSHKLYERRLKLERIINEI